MAILFEWYENPVAPNQPQEETKLHARITLNGKTGTDRLRRKIQERCSLTETDVSAVLDALSHAMGEDICRPPRRLQNAAPKNGGLSGSLLFFQCPYVQPPSEYLLTDIIY